jgi:ADP-heptose:LPS heptosyltransferase
MPELFLTEREFANAKSLLAAVPHPRVALHPISTFSTKNWQHRRWEEVVKDNSRYAFVQIGNATERRIAGTVDLRGTSLRVAFAVIGACDALVGVDSGMAHAATALGIPCVVLFGASSTAVYGHDVNANLSANARVKCQPCLELLFDETCPFDNKCMRGITVDAVSIELTRIVSGRSGSAGSGEFSLVRTK